MHISVHGLVRGVDPELGADPDTGGQVRYVIDLLKALDDHPRIGRADLLTRKIADPNISAEYALAVEPVSEKTTIYRINCGPRRYLRKETLWPYLQEFVDNTFRYIRSQKRMPDVLHAHYADAGWVASRLAKILGIPIIFTGHSLGRYKLKRLLANGMDTDQAEKLYHFKARIEAEEEVLEQAAAVIASTELEVNDQYRLYDGRSNNDVTILPPGCEVERFSAVPNPGEHNDLQALLAPFLRDPALPAIMVVARADPQKNIEAAIHAFGKSTLRSRANLILFIGNREGFGDMAPGERKLYTEILRLIDHYDLYGHVAYPKRHVPHNLTALYSHCHETGGVALNLSRHENFGLTLVEAAAAGVPVVSSAAGGMREVLAVCQHGLIVDPDDHMATASAIARLLDDKEDWQERSRLGQQAAMAHYRWSSHVGKYVAMVDSIISARPQLNAIDYRPKRLVSASQFLMSDIDDTLTGDRRAIERFNTVIEEQEDILFGIATGRHLASALATLKQWNIVTPTFCVSSVGTAIHYNVNGFVEDRDWQHHIQAGWKPDLVHQICDGLPGLTLQEEEAQGRFKISYYRTPQAPGIREIKKLLRSNSVQARVIISRERCLDILPTRASKGNAMRYLAWKWQFDLAKVITSGDAGNDLDMLGGGVRSIVVANHSRELEMLRQRDGIYFATGKYAAGVIEGLEHYGVSGETYVAQQYETRIAS